MMVISGDNRWHMMLVELISHASGKMYHDTRGYVYLFCAHTYVNENIYPCKNISICWRFVKSLYCAYENDFQDLELLSVAMMIRVINIMPIGMFSLLL